VTPDVVEPRAGDDARHVVAASPRLAAAEDEVLDVVRVELGSLASTTLTARRRGRRTALDERALHGTADGGAPVATMTASGMECSFEAWWMLDGSTVAALPTVMNVASAKSNRVTAQRRLRWPRDQNCNVLLTGCAGRRQWCDVGADAR